MGLGTRLCMNCVQWAPWSFTYSCVARTACPSGTYLSPSNGSCSDCPANSVSEEEGLAQCILCIEGYQRAEQGEEDLPCTGKIWDACCNLFTIHVFTITSLFISVVQSSTLQQATTLPLLYSLTLILASLLYQWGILMQDCHTVCRSIKLLRQEVAYCCYNTIIITCEAWFYRPHIRDYIYMYTNYVQRSLVSKLYADWHSLCHGSAQIKDGEGQCYTSAISLFVFFSITRAGWIDACWALNHTPVQWRGWGLHPRSQWC